jgi:hypothetical protein
MSIRSLQSSTNSSSRDPEGFKTSPELIYHDRGDSGRSDPEPLGHLAVIPPPPHNPDHSSSASPTSSHSSSSRRRREPSRPQPATWDEEEEEEDEGQLEEGGGGDSPISLVQLQPNDDDDEPMSSIAASGISHGEWLAPSDSSSTTAVSTTRSTRTDPFPSQSPRAHSLHSRRREDRHHPHNNNHGKRRASSSNSSNRRRPQEAPSMMVQEQQPPQDPQQQNLAPPAAVSGGRRTTTTDHHKQQQRPADSFLPVFKDQTAGSDIMVEGGGFGGDGEGPTAIQRNELYSSHFPATAGASHNVASASSSSSSVVHAHAIGYAEVAVVNAVLYTSTNNDDSDDKVRQGSQSAPLPTTNDVDRPSHTHTKLTTNHSTMDDLEQQQQQPQQQQLEHFQQQQQEQQKKKKCRRIMWIAVAVVLVAGIGTAVAVFAMGGGGGKAKEEAFVPVGGPILPTTAQSPFFGSDVAVSSDGNRIVVASINTVTAYALVGDEPSSSSWQQLGQTINVAQTNGDTTEGRPPKILDQGLISIAIGSQGTILAVGHGEAANMTGAVDLYILVGTTWVGLGASLTGAAVGDRFGTAVDLSADEQPIVVAIGAPGYNGGAGLIQVYAYDADGDAWVPRGGRIEGEVSSTVRGLGGSVALSRDGLRVAAAGRSIPDPATPLRSAVVRTFDFAAIAGSRSMLGSSHPVLSNLVPAGRSTCRPMAIVW